MSVGGRIRESRTAKGYTQKVLSAKSGIIETTIRKYELGIIEPKRENLQRLANALDTSVLYLIDKCEVNSVIDSQIQVACSQLNDAGKQKVIEYAEDLLKISEYKNTEEV